MGGEHPGAQGRGETRGRERWKTRHTHREALDTSSCHPARALTQGWTRRGDPPLLHEDQNQRACWEPPGRPHTNLSSPTLASQHCCPE